MEVKLIRKSRNALNVVSGRLPGSLTALASGTLNALSCISSCPAALADAEFQGAEKVALLLRQFGDLWPDRRLDPNVWGIPLSQLHRFGLAQAARPQSASANAVRSADMLRLTTTGFLVLDAAQKLTRLPDGAEVRIAGLSHYEWSLHSRVALARARTLSRSRELDLALALAFEAGYTAHPEERPSAQVVSEPQLLGQWQEGWAKRAFETRPLTEQDLAETIERIAKEADQGCGLFYELYAQKFTGMVDDWLPTLRENERLTALQLLAKHDYFPEAIGVWVYDQEEGDIHLIGGDEEGA